MYILWYIDLQRPIDWIWCSGIPLIKLPWQNLCGKSGIIKAAWGILRCYKVLVRFAENWYGVRGLLLKWQSSGPSTGGHTERFFFRACCNIEDSWSLGINLVVPFTVCYDFENCRKKWMVWHVIEPAMALKTLVGYVPNVIVNSPTRKKPK